MADFCHEFDPGGLGCGFHSNCPSNCLGDYTDLAKRWAEELRDPEWQDSPPTKRVYVPLGICEGHGGHLWLRFSPGGKFDTVCTTSLDTDPSLHPYRFNWTPWSPNG